MSIRPFLALAAVSVAAVSVAAVSAAGPAVAGPPPATGPEGVVCGFSTLLERGHRVTAEIDGGPLVATDAAGLPAGGTLTCSIQVSALAHSAPDAAGESADGIGAVVLEPRVVSFAAAPADYLALCTRFAYDGGPTLYWHTGNELGEDPYWTTDPDAECSLAIATD